MRDHLLPRRLASALTTLTIAAALVCAGGVLGLRAQSQPAAAPDESVTLSARQTVQIRVGRWDPIEETYTPWDSLGGEFTIPPGGDLSLPMIGTVSALGRTPEELAAEISGALQEQMGIRGDVQAGVTITGFEPVYVLGDVTSPGSYPYSPGMTVLQALTQAGGIDGPGPELLRGDRSALTSLGNYRVMQLDLMRRLATMARLRAELEEHEIETPDELADAAMGEELIAQEHEIKVARDSAFRSSLSQLDELEKLLQQRIDRLDRQVELREKQRTLIEDELESASELVEKGLSTANRESSLQRQLADQQVRRLELETARLNAEQQLNETKRDRLDLINTRRRDLVQGLQDQRSAVGELRIKMETEAALYSEARQTGNGLAQLQDGTAPALQVTRTEDGESRSFAVKRTDRVRGGDVIEVRLPVLQPYDSIPVRRFDALGGPDLPQDLSGATPPAAAGAAKAEDGEADGPPS